MDPGDRSSPPVVSVTVASRARGDRYRSLTRKSFAPFCNALANATDGNLLVGVNIIKYQDGRRPGIDNEIDVVVAETDVRSQDCQVIMKMARKDVAYAVADNEDLG
jgi:hypothetical protein